MALLVGCIRATPPPRYMSQPFAPALTRSSTDTRLSAGWNTAGSGGTLTRAIAQGRLGDRGDDLGRGRFSLRGQRPWVVGADVPRPGAPLRARFHRRSHSRYDVRIRGRTGWPPRLAGRGQRVAGPVPTHALGHRRRDDRLRLLP